MSPTLSRADVRNLAAIFQALTIAYFRGSEIEYWSRTPHRKDVCRTGRIKHFSVGSVGNGDGHLAIYDNALGDCSLTVGPHDTCLIQSE